jgi:hypothetical protein
MGVAHGHSPAKRELPCVIRNHSNRSLDGISSLLFLWSRKIEEDDDWQLAEGRRK